MGPSLINTSISPMTTASSQGDENSDDYYKGLALALSSCIFIGTSFIVKKKGLLKVARNSSSRAGKEFYLYFRVCLAPSFIHSSNKRH